MATIFAPIMFKWSLGIYQRATPVVRSSTIGGQEASGQGFIIRIKAKFHPGVQRKVLHTLHESGVYVLAMNATGHRKMGIASHGELERFHDTMVVMPKGAQKDFDEEKLDEILHHLFEVVNDHDADITFEPYEIGEHVFAPAPHSKRTSSERRMSSRASVSAGMLAIQVENRDSVRSNASDGSSPLEGVTLNKM